MATDASTHTSFQTPRLLIGAPADIAPRAKTAATDLRNAGGADALLNAGGRAVRGATNMDVTAAAITDVIHVHLHEDAATTATTDEVRGAEAPADLGPRHVTAAVITTVIVAAIDPTAVTEAVADQNLVTHDVLRDPAPPHRATVSAPPRLPFALGAAGTGATSFANAFWWLHTQETIRPRRAASAFAFGPTKSTPTSSRSHDTPPCVRGKRHPTRVRL